MLKDFERHLKSQCVSKDGAEPGREDTRWPSYHFLFVSRGLALP